MLCAFTSCHSPKQLNPPPAIKNITIYSGSNKQITGFFFSDTDYGTIYRKYKSENEAIDNHFLNPAVFLEEYLSVNNEEWYNKMYVNNNPTRSLSLNLIANRNLSREESIEILKAFVIVYDSTQYNIIKIRHKDYTDKTTIEQMILKLVGDRFYIVKDIKDPYLNNIIETFYLPKQEIGIGLTDYTSVSDFPPSSGNPTLDRIISDEIYYNFKVTNKLNISRFIYTTEEWKKEGKTGLLNYFF